LQTPSIKDSHPANDGPAHKLTKETGRKSKKQCNTVGLIGRKTFQKEVEAMTGRHLVGQAQGQPKRTAGTTIEKVL
jgi:hypothetical protein